MVRVSNRRSPVLLETTTSLRSGGTTPIHSTTGNWYAIYALEVPPPIRAGDVLDVTATLHFTYVAFRPDSTSVVWNSIMVWSSDLSDSQSGTNVMGNARTYRVGDEAHHGLIVRRAAFVVPSDVFDAPRYLKFLCYFTHGNANGSQMMTCPDNGFGVQALWYRQ